MAAGRRVLVSGMGGDLGSRVAALLEDEPWVGELVGIDVDPPRRRLHRAEFHLVAPDDHDRIVETGHRVQPARRRAHRRSGSRSAGPTRRRPASSPTRRRRRSSAPPPSAGRWSRSSCAAASRSTAGPAARRPAPTSRRRRRPDVRVRPHARRDRAHRRRDRPARSASPSAPIRMGTVLGPHVPSPLGRLLRMPAVPFSVLADPPFAVVEDIECARAFVAAAERRLAEPVNVVANGAITALQAIRRGRRIPIPLVGPDWAIATADQRAARRADPRPRHRDAAPRAPRRQLADGRAARLHADGRPPSRSIDKLYALAERSMRTPARQAVA